MLFRVEVPNIDPVLGLSYYPIKHLYLEPLGAVKRAKASGGRVIAVDGANNRQTNDFWAGSSAESQLESILKAEKLSYRDWKGRHNAAQVFCHA